ncbi:dethiobiotin synthetase [Chryseobacterium defluvii]|uniref:ATP-dependent dethiobiotin synthetase BioD n=1 Tax=Chryseobacterium defluvii TaxID=160396 RepID=A0A840KBX7_9FLAO|nr:dethiobiotin synthase [Chryseobacterium defluvii]MBB4805498.1 dethiobiotin synthetase [Chryseobacterium defluvii]
MIREKLFVTGIGTGVGKTVCSAVLARYFEADYWKPVQSGDLHYTDSMTIKDLTGNDVFCHRETYRLKLAASPHQSGAEEGICINTDDFSLPETQRSLIVEGAGGLMVPLSDRELIIDLIEKLDLAVALVVKNYLGCINHSLLSIMAINQRELQLKYLILNGDFPEDTERVICSYVSIETTIIRIPDLDPPTKENIEKTALDLFNKYKPQRHKSFLP